MDPKEFRLYAHQIVDWMADYLDHIEAYPVKSQVQPREIINHLPDSPPKSGEKFENIIEDFKKIIVPGITHWQHPRFFAYFPANNSKISILAEMLTATLGAQCMSWITSPAATELEERMMSWLRDMIGLPVEFTGVIQDTASTATICSLLTARESKTNFVVNRKGLFHRKPLTVYCSTEGHSSIEKAVKAIGIGNENMRRIPVDDTFAMIPAKLRNRIEEDADNVFSRVVQSERIRGGEQDGWCIFSRSALTNEINPHGGRGNGIKTEDLYGYIIPHLESEGLVSRWKRNGDPRTEYFGVRPEA